MKKAKTSHNTFSQDKESRHILIMPFYRYYSLAKKLFICCTVSFLSFTIICCKKLVDTPVPTDQVAENAVYGNNATAISVLTGIYNSMNTAPFQGSLTSGSISLFAGLSADEYTLAPGITNASYIAYYQNALSQPNIGTVTGGEHYTFLYQQIFVCNAAIEGLTSSKSDELTPAIREQLLGEAKFMRGFLYFYLTSEFGDVPLVLGTDPEKNTLLARASKTEVYDKIITDLLDAQEKLSSNYLDATLLQTTSERVRPTKWAAAALLARLYLYTGINYAKAEEQASLVINNTTLFGPISTIPLNKVFLKNSREAIWQIQPTTVNLNTQEGKSLIIPPTGPSTGGFLGNPVLLSNQLLKSFEPADHRKEFGNWIDTTIYTVTTSPLVRDTVAYPFKYKINASAGVSSIAGLSEYFMVLRLAEQYLIRAEARAHLGNISGAQADLNAIRNRASLPNTTATDHASLIDAIINEKRHELFTEWGHRWFDLQRTGKIDAVMTVSTPLKASGAPWKSYQALYPLPLKDIQLSPNLVQNPGYN